MFADCLYASQRTGRIIIHMYTYFVEKKTNKILNASIFSYNVFYFLFVTGTFLSFQFQ
ncbi:Uncharacterised protein [uncultured Flavonifractor sp.]|nr:Uncharacterised protein [uncultured Flavonifractor sp.]